MITYDNHGSLLDPLKALVRNNTPDQIEVGENNLVWFFVVRSTRKIELISKEHGGVVARCAVDDEALSYGISPAQLSAAKEALKERWQPGS